VKLADLITRMMPCPADSLSVLIASNCRVQDVPRRLAAIESACHLAPLQGRNRRGIECFFEGKSS
jgi:hypothetical protein